MNTMHVRLFGMLLIAGIAIVPASAYAATASFDEEDMVTTTTKPTITGEADDIEKLRLVVRNEDNKIVYKRDVRVKEGEWKARIARSLKKGEYELSLYAGRSTRGEALATTDLTLESKSKSKKGGGNGTTLSVSSVPLLFGGTARANTSVPVAYIKVVNTSTKDSAIEGFTLTQHGSAPTSVITGFATSDDKGGSRTTVAAPFKGTNVYVPLQAAFAPGQMRIFTIKAMVGMNAITNIGSQLMLDVASVDSSAGIKGTFPIPGTTWTLGY
jgi:hypothetical protein